MTGKQFFILTIFAISSTFMVGQKNSTSVISLWKNKARGIWISSVMMIFFVVIGISVIMMEFGLVVRTGAELDGGKVYSFAFISLPNLITTILTYSKLAINTP